MYVAITISEVGELIVSFEKREDAEEYARRQTVSRVAQVSTIVTVVDDPVALVADTREVVEVLTAEMIRRGINVVRLEKNTRPQRDQIC